MRQENAHVVMMRVNGAARRGGRGSGEAVDATVGERANGRAVVAGASGDRGGSAVDVWMGLRAVVENAHVVVTLMNGAARRGGR